MKKTILFACICLLVACSKDEEIKPALTAEDFAGWASLGNTIFNVDSSVYDGPVNNPDSLVQGVDAGQIK